MAWGDKSPRIIAMLKESGQTDAVGDRPAYDPQPILPGYLTFYYEAFWDLANYEGIPFADLDRYASRYGVEGVDDFDRFKTLIRRLNSVWYGIVSTPDKEVTDDDAKPESRKPKPKVLG